MLHTTTQNHNRTIKISVLPSAEVFWVELHTYLLKGYLIDSRNGLIKLVFSVCHELGAYHVCSKLTKLHQLSDIWLDLQRSLACRMTLLILSNIQICLS